MLPKTLSETQEFDALAFEVKRERIFNQTESSTDFLDGDWDSRLGTANPQRWLTSNHYRRGYLSGIEESLTDRFAQSI